MTAILTILALASFVLILMAAGYPIMRFWIESHLKVNIFGATAISFSLGLALWTWLTWIAYLLEFNLYVLLAVYLVSAIGFYALLYVNKMRIDLAQYFQLSGYEWGTFGAMLALMAVYYLVGSFQDPSADSFGHLAFIRKLMEQPIVSVEIFIASANVPYNLGNGAYAYTTIYPLIAAVSQIFSVDPALIWFHLPGVMAFVFISAFLFLAYSALNEKRYVLVFSLLLLLSWALWGHGLRGVGYPNTLSFIMYLVAMGAVLGISIRQIQWSAKFVSVLVFMSASMVLVHSQWWAFLFGTLGLWAIFNLVLRRYREALSGGVVLALVGLFSLPLLFTKTSFYQIIASELENVLLYRYTEKLFYIGNMYAFNLFETLNIQHFLLIICALISLFFMMRRKLKLEVVLGVAFSAFVVVAIALVMINPVLVPIISEFATTTIAARMRNLIRDWGLLPIAFLIPALLPELRNFWVRTSNFARSAIVVFGVSSIAAFLFYQPALRFARNLARPESREAVIQFFSEKLGIGEATLRSIYENIALVIAGGALASVIVFAALVILVRFRIAGKIDLKPLIQHRALPVVLPILLTLGLLIVPSSKLSPWNSIRADVQYGSLYGPTLTQTMRSDQMARLYELFDRESVVVSDFRKSLLAFRDVLIAGDVQNELQSAKEINDYIRPFFDVKTKNQDLLERLIELNPDYFVLSPRHSHLAWMKYDYFGGALSKIFDEVIDGIDYYNNRFVVYRVNTEAAQTALSESSLEESIPAKVAPPSDCVSHRLYSAYAYDLEPRGWNPIGNELIDGKWTQTANSLLWVPLRTNWFYIEFDLGDQHYIDRVEVKNYHFSSGYQLNALRLYGSEDRAKYHLIDSIDFEEKHKLGKHVWLFENVSQNAKSVRIAINSQSSTTIGEVEIYGCLIGEG